MTKEFPVPVIAASVGVGILSVPFHGVFQTMLVTLGTVGVAMFARQSALNTRSTTRF
jgi:hypothetical protein